MLNKTQLSTIFPNAEASSIDAFVSAGLTALKSAGILDGVNRLAFFLAQLGHESNGLTVREENLNYSANRLMKVWPSRFPTLDAAKKYENNPEKLANFVYGGRLGNVDDGDGFKYRGRGYIQLTGRDTYRQMGTLVGIDLEKNPDLASRPDNAAKIACAYWTARKINPACDTGDFVQVTRLINGGTTGLADREAWLAKVQKVLSTAPTPTPVQPETRPQPVPPPPVPPLTPTNHTTADDEPETFANEAIRMAQAKLKRLGFYNGTLDGVFSGPMRTALLQFQRQEGLNPSGRLDADTMAELNV